MNEYGESCLYVNYAPYGNSGHILDYLRESFDALVYISFIFHPVSRKNVVEIYKHRKLIKTISMPALIVGRNHVHYFAPLLSMIHAMMLFGIIIYVIIKFGIRPKIFLATNAFLIWLGVIFRSISFVERVIFWVWDYYPVPDAGAYKRIFYGLYWILDKCCMRKSDFLWLISSRLRKMHKELGFLVPQNKYLVVPLGMKAIDRAIIPGVQQNTFGFIGVLKKSQGVEMILSSLSELASKISDLRVEIIGSGPDMQYFKAMADRNSEGHRIIFHGFINNPVELQRRIASWGAAAALYIPWDKTLSAYADPNKVKLCIECGTPVIITKVPEIAEEICRRGAGIAIEYNTGELVKALIRILSENNKFRENARKISQEYNYEKIYDDVFNLTRERLGIK